MKLFEIEWIKDSGGAIEYFTAKDIRECLKNFNLAWGDPYSRRVIRIQEIQDCELEIEELIIYTQWLKKEKLLKEKLSSLKIVKEYINR